MYRKRMVRSPWMHNNETFSASHYMRIYHHSEKNNFPPLRENVISSISIGHFQIVVSIMLYSQDKSRIEPLLHASYRDCEILH